MELILMQIRGARARNDHLWAHAVKDRRLARPELIVNILGLLTIKDFFDK